MICPIGGLDLNGNELARLKQVRMSGRDAERAGERASGRARERASEKKKFILIERRPGGAGSLSSLLSIKGIVLGPGPADGRCLAARERRAPRLPIRRKQWAPDVAPKVKIDARERALAYKRAGRPAGRPT